MQFKRRGGALATLEQRSSELEGLANQQRLSFAESYLSSTTTYNDTFAPLGLADEETTKLATKLAAQAAAQLQQDINTVHAGLAAKQAKRLNRQARIAKLAAVKSWTVPKISIPNLASQRANAIGGITALATGTATALATKDLATSVFSAGTALTVWKSARILRQERTLNSGQPKDQSPNSFATELGRRWTHLLWAALYFPAALPAGLSYAATSAVHVAARTFTSVPEDIKYKAKKEAKRTTENKSPTDEVALPTVEDIKRRVNTELGALAAAGLAGAATGNLNALWLNLVLSIAAQTSRGIGDNLKRRFLDQAQTRRRQWQQRRDELLELVPAQTVADKGDELAAKIELLVSQRTQITPDELAKWRTAQQAHTQATQWAQQNAKHVKARHKQQRLRSKKILTWRRNQERASPEVPPRDLPAAAFGLRRLGESVVGWASGTVTATALNMSSNIAAIPLANMAGGTLRGSLAEKSLSTHQASDRYAADIAHLILHESEQRLATAYGHAAIVVGEQLRKENRAIPMWLVEDSNKAIAIQTANEQLADKGRLAKVARSAKNAFSLQRQYRSQGYVRQGWLSGVANATASVALIPGPLGKTLGLIHMIFSGAMGHNEVLYHERHRNRINNKRYTKLTMQLQADSEGLNPASISTTAGKHTGLTKRYVEQNRLLTNNPELVDQAGKVAAAEIRLSSIRQQQAKIAANRR